MPAWMFEKRDFRSTPSALDGINAETENKYRREGARLIIDVGADLNLRFDTVATGCVYFHRFFMFHSFKEFNRYVTAIGCLFLAGKVEETPKKCRDLLRVARPRLSDQQFDAFGDDPKEEVMTIERVLLQTIKFDLQVEHPYQFLIKYAKILQGNKVGIENLVQMAWTFINDSLCTTICLQWEPEIVAIALMYLASRLGKCPINDWKNRKNVEGEKWWDQFVEDLSLDLLEEICHQVLDLYSPQMGGSGAPPVRNQPQTAGSAAANSNGTARSSAQQSPASVAGISPASGAPTTPGASNLVVINQVPSSQTQQHQPLVCRDSTKLPASTNAVLAQLPFGAGVQPSPGASTGVGGNMPQMLRRPPGGVPPHSTPTAPTIVTYDPYRQPPPPTFVLTAAAADPQLQQPPPPIMHFAGYAAPSPATYGRPPPAAASSGANSLGAYAAPQQPPSVYGRTYGRVYGDYNAHM